MAKKTSKDKAGKKAAKDRKKVAKTKSAAAKVGRKASKAGKASAKASKKASKKALKKSSKGPNSKGLNTKGAKEPAWRRIACKSLDDIRANIDRLDATIVPLLCERLHFVTQAANFKPSVAGVVVPARVEQIIASVRAMAEQLGARPETMERVYRELIDAFTADEQRHWGELNTQKRLSEKW